VLKDAVRRRLIDRSPADDRDLLVRASAPSRSYLEVAQLAALLEAAELLERESIGLTWERVGEIRASSASARALAREFGVSDSLIGEIRSASCGPAALGGLATTCRAGRSSPRLRSPARASPRPAFSTGRTWTSPAGRFASRA
jgi:hypothetical protein